MQILEAGILNNSLHAVMLDRGPLWFEGFGSADHYRLFLQEFARQFPRRLGRRRRLILEGADHPDLRRTLAESGFRQSRFDEYETYRIDLTQDKEAIFEGLSPKWRNKLRRPRAKDLTLEWDETGTHLPWLLEAYSSDRRQKEYEGPDPKLLQMMARHFIPGGFMLTGRAMLDNRALAAILIFSHGAAATYQIGWSSPEGRDYAAHNVLLWEACGVLQARGIKSFDLGGINDTKASGVKKFKQGMGGDLLRLPGLYH